MFVELLPIDIGFNFEDTIFNHLAYADDLVLIANNVEEHQHLLNINVSGLKRVGLQINICKSLTMCWVKEKKIKKMIYDSTSELFVDNRSLKTIC